MLCEKCHKNLATVRYAEVVDGKVRDVGLCPGCLAKHQEEAGLGFELAKPGPVPVRGKRAGTGGAKAPARAALGHERCGACGHSLAQVVETGKMGCGTCYETFAEQVEVILKGRHPGLRHPGKSPQVDDARARVRDGLQTKRVLLRSALRTENYEEAAHLRDEIRVLENELSAAERED